MGGETTEAWRAVLDVLISFLFAAIYKVLPDRNLEWGDVAVGAIVTGVLFTIGKPGPIDQL
jgi:membrane protein